MTDDMMHWPAEELPAPLYVVFCRLCFDPEIATDELAAMQKVLFEAAEEASKKPEFHVSIVRPSPYGRFLGLPQAAKALEAAQFVMDLSAQRGARLAIGVAAEERIEKVQDLNQDNIIGPTINLAARLAFHTESPGRILVTVPVADDAQRDSSAYRNCFGPVTTGRVKSTEFRFRGLLRRMGDLTAPPAGAEQLAAVAAVVYDVEKFSQLDLDGQFAAFTALNRHVIEQLGAVGAVDLMRSDRLWYAPAGDGGGVLFNSDRVDVAWTFAQLLCRACQGNVPIRIGIASGTVAVLGGGLPVGAAIIRADALSGYPSAGAMCVSRSFWMGRSAAERNRWKVVSRDVKPEHVSLLTEAWVLEPAESLVPAPSLVQSRHPAPPASDAAPAQPATATTVTAVRPQPEAPAATPAERPKPSSGPTPTAGSSGRKRLDLPQLIDSGLMNALTTAYPEQTSATMLLLAVGFPMHRIPSFQNPGSAWLSVCRDIAHGTPPGAFEPVLARAAADYPHNQTFAPYSK